MFSSFSEHAPALGMHVFLDSLEYARLFNALNSNLKKKKKENPLSPAFPSRLLKVELLFFDVVYLFCFASTLIFCPGSSRFFICLKMTSRNALCVATLHPEKISI